MAELRQIGGRVDGLGIFRLRDHQRDINLIAFPVVVVSAILLRDYVFSHFLPRSLAETVAHGVAIMIPVVFNFAAHRLVTFGRRAP